MSGSRQKTILVALMAATALTLFVTASCTFDRWAEVEPGHYVANAVDGGLGPSAAREIRSLDIDRDSETLVLTLGDGTHIEAAYVPRDRAAWPSGCPANINATRMEVLDIARDSLTIGETTFHRPILVRDCPREPVRIVLRGDGAMGGALTACPYPEPCIYFAP